MSEQVTESEYEPMPSRRQPAYGDGRFRYEEPTKSEEHIERWPHAMLAVVIVVSVLLTYLASGYGVYRILTAVI